MTKWTSYRGTDRGGHFTRRVLLISIFLRGSDSEITLTAAPPSTMLIRRVYGVDYGLTYQPGSASAVRNNG